MKSTFYLRRNKLIFFSMILFFNFGLKSQSVLLKIDSIKCYLLPEEIASYSQELSTSEVKKFSIMNGTYFNFDFNNTNCLDSFLMIDFCEYKLSPYKYERELITKLLIEVYLSNGIINTIEIDCLFFFRINHSEIIYNQNYKLLEWINRYLEVKIFSYWCTR